jgi:hypothetical protein
MLQLYWQLKDFAVSEKCFVPARLRAKSSSNCQSKYYLSNPN